MIKLPAFNSSEPQSGTRISIPPGRISGLTANDIDVVFQPLVDLGTGSLFAYEALVRARPEDLRNPLRLFQQATDEGVTGYLGRIIREVAFSRCPPSPLFVNLHPEELNSHWLVRPDDPMCLHEAGLFLEVTESAAFTHYGLCQRVLREVCARTGAKLVVDDLGAGYSNLARVIDLEPSVVKLDLSLIRDLDKRERQQKLVRHVVRLCEDLGAKVVAEGIETLDELKATIDTGAHFGQGYLLARPSFPLPRVSWPFSKHRALV